MTLAPATAAQIASAVYGIRQIANVERGIAGAKETNLLANTNFDFGKAAAIGGTSGAGIRSASGFSMVVPCRGTMQGEYIVATRGTVTAYDWLTDIAAAMEPGPGGCAVHAGFNRVARSVLLEINGHLRNKFPTKIHVVGHSLGGAVSNLLAASFTTNGIGCELYTFGAPRAGLEPFRQLLANDIGEGNIYRAFSMSDPYRWCRSTRSSTHPASTRPRCAGQDTAWSILLRTECPRTKPLSDPTCTGKTCETLRRSLP